MKNSTNVSVPLFRKAEEADLDRIWQIILQAKAQMQRLNSHQWDENYPARDTISQDIQAGNGYVYSQNNTVVAYGVISFDREPAYTEINGAWTNELPYLLVHRIAVADEAKNQGIAKRFLLQAEEISRQKGIYNFRIDTNFDNQYMLRLIDSLGFRYCGEVNYRGNQIRKAFEKRILPTRFSLGISNYTIREATYEDATAIYEAIDRNRDDLRTWLPFVDTLTSVADEQSFLASVLQVPYKQREPAFILEKGTEVCGLCGFHFSDFANYRTEIGYWLLPSHRGQGVVSEAVRDLCHWAIRAREIHRIQIRCAVENHSSNAIPRRLGFTLEGTERDGERLVSGLYTDIRVYSILRHEIEAW